MAIVWVRATLVLAMLAGASALIGPAQAQDGANAEATIEALQTEVARLQGDAPTEAPPRATDSPDDEEELREESRGGGQSEVNVEMILDVSGSMAEVLDTDETRMDAAKQVLRGVIAAIPDRDGVNVGLRIYGHEGDNSEAGQAVSCESSELVVPVEGVDKGALEDAIASLEPTGWTPIGLSLERAEEDFPDAGDGGTNAVVLVTDGLETCDGDPVAAADDLRRGSREIATHVIGFALTGEEQQRLAGIAESGDGLLLGAQNADELSAALFEVLQELEIVAGTGFVGGNAFTLVPPGETGELSVVAFGGVDALYAGSLPFVVRNNTGEEIQGVKINATARDGAGNLLAAADSLQVNPYVVNAGGLALGTVYFGDIDLPPDTEFEVDVESTPDSEARFSIFRDLDVTEAALFEDRIVGELENTQDEPVGGPILLSAVCFDLDGNLLSQNSGTLDVNEIEPGETEAFQVTLFRVQFGEQQCPAFLVAGAGLGS